MSRDLSWGPCASFVPHFPSSQLRRGGGGTAWMRFLFSLPGVWAAPFPFTQQVSQFSASPLPTAPIIFPTDTTFKEHFWKKKNVDSFPPKKSGLNGVKSKPPCSRFLNKRFPFTHSPKQVLWFLRREDKCVAGISVHGPQYAIFIFLFFFH